MNHKVTFEAEMDEADIGAMKDLFTFVMEQEMHIDCHNLQIEQKS